MSETQEGEAGTGATDRAEEIAMHRAKALSIVRDARVCMITVTDHMGSLQSRPMAPVNVTDSGEVSFLLDTTTAFAAQVGKGAQVNLSIAEGSVWLSISGRGKVIRSPKRVHEFWNAAAEAWFPDGPDDPRLGLLRVRGRTAEYWDAPGGRIASALSFLKAKATGEPLSTDNETVALG